MILPIILGILAALLFIDGLTAIMSTTYFHRRNKLFGLTAKAPEHLDANKYYLINRTIAGLCSMGAGSVVVYWIWQYLNLQ